MQAKKRFQIILDIIMIALLVILMAQRAMSVIWHEWLGITLFILLVLHNALNYRWLKYLFKGRYNRVRAMHTIVNIMILILTIICFISSIMISGYIFPHILNYKQLGRKLHLLTTAWLFVIISFHLGFHLEGFLLRKYQEIKSHLKIIIIVTTVALVLIGLYFFIFERKFYEELFLLTSFKDYLSKPLIIDILEIISMLIMLIILSINLKYILIRRKK